MRPDGGARRGADRQRAEDEPSLLRAARRPHALFARPRRRSSSSSRGGARTGCGSSCSRSARASSAAAKRAYEEALKLKPEDFDDQFDRYLKERFKPFRDKERPADYGRNIAPDPERSSFVVGHLARAVAERRLARRRGRQPARSGAGHRPDFGARRTVHPQPDQGTSTRTGDSSGSAARRTSGATSCPGSPGRRSATGWRISRAPKSPSRSSSRTSSPAARRNASRCTEVDGPESPAFSPDGRKVAFAAMTGGLSDIYTIDIESGALTNVTKDTIADYSPAFSPDGTSIVYTARVGANDKLFQIDARHGRQEADHVRQPRRHRRQVLRRSHDRLHVDGDRPERVAAGRGRARRQHPERLDARSLDEPAAPDGRIRRPATCRRSSSVRRRAPRRVRLLLQGPLRHSRASRARSRSPSVASEDFGGPGPVFEFTAPAQPHAAARQHPQKGRVREDEPGRPAAGRARRDERRRPLRQHRRSRSPTCWATRKSASTRSRSCSTGRRRSPTSTSAAGCNYAIQGFSQDLFYFGQDLTASGALYDPAIARVHRPR